MTTPTLVAIEGIDGAGKETQAQRLCAHLADQGAEVDLRSFPAYTSFFGQQVAAMLARPDGTNEPDGTTPTVPRAAAPSATDVDPRSMALWYALDRWDALRREPLAGDVVVFNRFTLSNAVYQSARLAIETGEPPGGAADGPAPAIGTTGSAADELFEWVLQLEHDRLGLPRPELTVVLDVPPALSHRRTGQRARAVAERDIDAYERSANLLSVARDRYLQAAAGQTDVVAVPCLDEAGQARTIDTVHKAVIAQLP